MAGRLLALFALAVAVPRFALAEPAQIRVFEAPARAEPSTEAPVLHVFVEGANVSVSEQPENGWRRVRLPNGATGWIEDGALSFPGAGELTPSSPPAAAPPPPPFAAPSLNIHPAIYVSDLDHLAELVKDDPAVGPMAKKLIARQHAAQGIAIGGTALTLGLFVAGANQMSRHSSPRDPQFGKDEATPYFLGSMVALVASGIVTLMTMPKGGDAVDVLSAWNASHPDRPFSFQPTYQYVETSPALIAP